jgi:hypothetical protein
MTVLALDATKHCNSCRTDKPLDQFARNRTRRDGLADWCRSCMADYMADYSDGLRRLRDLVRGDRSVNGPFICVCARVVVHTDQKTCVVCRYPVVARMHPDLQAAMAAKYPPITDQQVVDLTEAQAVPA